AGETYTIAPEITVNTLPVTGLSSTGATLQGSVKSIVEDVTVGVDYGNSPFLTGAIHVNAAVNGTVTAGSGAKTAEFQLSQVKPGEHYYRVTATTATNEVVNGEILSFDIPATIIGITALSPNPNNASTGLITYEVEFSNVITGLGKINFDLTLGGAVTGSSILSVAKSADPAKPNSWVVKVGIGNGGDGTIALNLKDATGLNAALSNALPFTGDTYTIAPDVVVTTQAATNVNVAEATLNGLVKTTTGNVNVSFDVSTVADFSSSVNFQPTTNPVVTPAMNSTVSTLFLEGTGLYYYRVVAKNAQNETYTGETKEVLIPASVLSITQLSNNPNNGIAGQVVYEVNFSGLVTGLTANNFGLTTGGTITGASILSVLKSNNLSKPYTWQVEVGFGNNGGDGTIT
ncbi:MAG: hypothetical protein WC622_13725, partial [Pedobacter sp.]|uniref:hypothetical protein n=1 Tax=Pedobacter sp. TaxID=1411316 RepID=UPI003565717B